MGYETRAYDNEHGEPVVVMVVTGTHDVSRLVHRMMGSVATVEQLEVGEKVLRQVRRHNGGLAALKLLKAHGGRDFTSTPIRFTATGFGVTTVDATGEKTLNVDTEVGRVHIDLGTEFAEPMALLLIDDPACSDGVFCPDDEPLIDPDCRDGKCSSCVGGPCEHLCHQAETGAEPPAGFTDALGTARLAGGEQ